MNNYHLASCASSGGAGAMFAVYWPGVNYPLASALFLLAISIIFRFIGNKKVAK